MLLLLCKERRNVVFYVACYFIVCNLIERFSVAVNQEKGNDHFVIFLFFGLFDIV